MANVILIVDPDPSRRASAAHAAAPGLPPVEGLVLGYASHGDLAAVWACSPENPASGSVADPDTCMVWGEAVGPDGTAVSAERLRLLWGRAAHRSAETPPRTFDGCYAAAAYDPSGGLIVAADPLGLFPIYYWQNGGGIVVATSPELFRCHPGFVPRFNPPGLAGILLTNGLLDGQTVWRGVQRLAPGHALVWRPGGEAREIRQYAPAVSTRYFDLPLSGQADVLEHALTGIIGRRLPPGEPVGMFMSGGLDSRTLAGLFRRSGRPVRAVTYGEPRDIEWQCARRVAGAAGVSQRGVRIPQERLVEAAELKIRWEHLANGFSPLDDWLFFPDLRALPRRVVGGHIMGAVLGCNVMRGAGEAGAVGFDHFLSTVTAWGIAPPVLARLLRRDVFGDAVSDLVCRLRGIYEATEGFGYQRLWRFALHHRERFYVGVAAWQLSFGCVPVFPGADRALVDAAAGMPAAALEGRRAQVELLCRRFPELARLPLDRNSHDASPLLLEPVGVLREAVRRRLSPSRYLPRLRREPRYYYRMFDLDGPGWKAIRLLAEPARARVAELVNPDVLDALLPPPRAPLGAEEPFTGRGAERLLLGLFLWAKRYL